ncbi:hypothetical protein HF1_05550 [Mycoplasma haemofelis str. Langford 1]|uniref:Uncharacterized protein n=1 Tax=Mycoplasma haemofelis (strain Langford 1) TaxID=941640 RepID=E8ZHE2_MYCHL|nr:hypothetical protein [Mycoplasma haemofelis]CBY92563.1 hypothetical protein HF1_05550 [Mycoplasma haemofelis str. Langford 1]
MMGTAGTAVSPIVTPIRNGVVQLTEQLDNFSKQGYNAGVDAKSWVTDNFNKSKIKSGGTRIYENLKSGYEAVAAFSKEAHSTIKRFFENWESNRETLHIIFKSIGNSFSLLGGLINSSSAGESKIKILFEVLSHEKFRSFADAAGSLTSKNPNLFPELQGDDIYDILTAFRQEPDDVVRILKELSEKGENKTNRETLVSALRLQSLMGRADSLAKKVKKFLDSKNTEEAKKLRSEVEKVIGELTALLKLQEALTES